MTPDLLPTTKAAVGIDLGLTHFAVLSDGRKIDSPKFLRRAEKKLKRAQRALSRKAERQQQPRQGPAQGRSGPRPGGRRPTRVPPPALNRDHPREPSGCR